MYRGGLSASTLFKIGFESDMGAAQYLRRTEHDQVRSLYFMPSTASDEYCPNYRIMLKDHGPILGTDGDFYDLESVGTLCRVSSNVLASAVQQNAGLLCGMCSLYVLFQIPTVSLQRM